MTHMDLGLHNLVAVPGSLQKIKRVGRGQGSGHGRTSGRGHKGQKSRKSGNVRPGFEGGQNPLYRRTPKGGFSRAVFMKKNEQFVSVNVGILEAAFSADAVVGIEELIARGLVRGKSRKVKILGEGDISKSLVIKAHAFSKGAQEKIEKSGGRVELIGNSSVEK